MSTFTELSEAFLMPSDVEPKRTIARAIWERAKTGKCLHCDLPAYRRGICYRHYYQYKTNLRSTPRDRRKLFHDTAVREGKILPNRQGQRPNAEDVFEDVAGRVERVGA